MNSILNISCIALTLAMVGGLWAAGMKLVGDVASAIADDASNDRR